MEGKFKWFVKAECTQLQERYWPTCWAFGTHAQTALANAIRNTLPNLTYTRRVLNQKGKAIAILCLSIFARVNAFLGTKGRTTADRELVTAVR